MSSSERTPAPGMCSRLTKGATELKASEGDLPVVVVGEEVGIDEWLVGRVGGPQGHLADAARSQVAGVDRHPMALDALAAVVDDEGRETVDLDVRGADLVAAAGKRAGLTDASGQGAVLEHQVLQAVEDHPVGAV